MPEDVIFSILFKVWYHDLDNNERTFTIDAKNANEARQLFRESHPCAASGEYKIFQVEKLVIQEHSPPYGEWCRDKKACAGKSYCPLDPTCGD